MRQPLLLVDAASLYFRAYFGVPPTVGTAPDGTPVNAVRGFLDALTTLIRGRRPGRMVCALDTAWRPAWRVALVESYKAHRAAADGAEATPPELAVQVPIILEALAALGITTLGAEDFEADDVLATLAAREPGPVEVVTGDRDLLQVIDDDRGVQVLYCGKGVAKLEVFDDAAVLARFGVPASRYVDLATLRGDPSDGLPGVSGVGAKTAARLIGRYGGLAGIMAALDDQDPDLAGTLATRIASARQYLSAAAMVTTARVDVPLPATRLTLSAAAVDPDAVDLLAGRYGLAGPLRRITAAIGDTGATVDGPQPIPR